MSKQPHKWIIADGELKRSGPFEDDAVVFANTKAEATRMVLERYKNMIDRRPLLFVRGNAFMLLSHDGRKFVAESGYLDRLDTAGQVHSLTIATHPTFNSALSDSTFAYYAMNAEEAAKREAQK